MAMKMDRRAFLKTSAAVAVAVSMTGLLGGCSDGAIGTDFGLFQATAGAAHVVLTPTAGVAPGKRMGGAISRSKVRIKDTSGMKKPDSLRAGPFSS